MTPRMATKSAFRVVGFEIKTKPGSSEIGALWRLFRSSIRDFPRVEAGVSYGLMQLDHQTGVLRYMAGEAIREDAVAANAWSVEASDYAVFEATLENVSQVFKYAYAQWLPQSNFQRGLGPDLERYGTDFGTHHPIFEVWIPIRQLQ